MKKIMSLVLTVCAALAAQAQSPAPSVTVNGVQYVLAYTNQPASVGVYVAPVLPSAAVLATSAPGASPAPATKAPTLVDTLSLGASWLGNINTNYSYQDVILWDGPVYENQVNIANELGGSYDIWHSVTGPTTNGLIFGAIESRSRQAGIAGSWLSEGLGGEFGWQKCSFRGGVFVDGIYLNHPSAVGAKSRLGAEGGVFMDDMLSAATAAGVFISGQTGQKYPIIGANLKVTFGNGGGFLGLFGATKPVVPSS